MSKLPLGQTVLRASRLSGRYQYAVSTTAFSRFSVILAAMDDRAAMMSEIYGSWRFDGVRISIMGREHTEFNLAVYFNSPTATVPSTVEELQDLPYYAQGSGLFGCPTPAIEIKKRELDKLRQVNWFNSQLSSTDSEFEYQFEIYAYAPFATLNYVVRIEYMVSLTAPADPQSLLTSPSAWYERQSVARRNNVGVIYRDSRTPEEKKSKTCVGLLDAADSEPGTVVLTTYSSATSAPAGKSAPASRQNTSGSNPEGRALNRSHPK